MPKKKATWKDIFTDATTYGDDMTIALKDAQGNDISYNLGDLRAYNEEHDGELLKSLEPEKQQLEADKQQLDAARQEVLKIYNKTKGAATDQIEGDKKVTKSAVADQFQLDESDPLVGQIVKELNKVKGDTDAKLTALATAMEQFKGITGTMLKSYINRSVADQFRSMQSDINALPEKSRSKYSQKALREHAEKMHLNDEDGMPDLQRAFKDLAGDELYAARREQDRTEDRKKWEQEQRMAAQRETQGVRLAGDKVPKPAIDVMKSKDPLGEALALAAQDDDLWNGVLNSGNA